MRIVFTALKELSIRFNKNMHLCVVTKTKEIKAIENDNVQIFRALGIKIPKFILSETVVE